MNFTLTKKHSVLKHLVKYENKQKDIFRQAITNKAYNQIPFWITHYSIVHDKKNK